MVCEVGFRKPAPERQYRALGHFGCQTLAVHPTFWFDLRQPILCRRDASQVFLNMLLSNVSNGNLLPVAVGDRDGENLLAQENTSAWCRGL
jgi:hypothetical protein